MDIYTFGRQLLETNDLDPVYVLIHEAGFEERLLKKWLLAYWCFYHVGTACWICSGDFWGRMETAAGSKDYPRSSERRHYRGDNALTSVAWLKEQDVDGLWDDFDRAAYERRVLLATDVMEYVQEWKGFGPWISFKVADMLDRLGLVQVRFAIDEVMYDSPVKAAGQLWEMESQPDYSTTIGEWAISRVLKEIGPVLAPPRYERPINMQEAETILCKWKSSLTGHYHVGDDIAACRKGLLRFARTALSQEMLRAGKKGGLWS